MDPLIESYAKIKLVLDCNESELNYINARIEAMRVKIYENCKNMIQKASMMHIVEVNAKDVDPFTLNYLNSFFVVFKEEYSTACHIINIELAIEDITEAASTILRLEVIELSKLCKENDTKYLRFIN